MCGICCYIGSDDAFDFILKGLTILQNRGYDSCGISSCSNNIINNCIKTSKFASSDSQSSIEKIKEYFYEHLHNNIGIGHTRWATHGSKTDKNAHPHSDNKNRISIVHNGIIENYATLYEILIKKGYVFHSETDTEVIANLIGSFLDDGEDINTAIKNTEQLLIGTWGVALLYVNEPNNLYLFKNGSPLLVGISSNKKYAFVASEQSAFSNYIQQYYSLHDKQLLVLSRENNIIIESVYSNKNIENKMIPTINEYIQETPDPFPHFTLKEIYEQSATVLHAINNGGRLKNESEVHLGGLNSKVDYLYNIKHLLIIACGTSYNAGLLASKYMRELRAFNSVRVIDAAEFTIFDIPEDYSEYGVLVVSQSGETRDIVTALNIIKNIPVISVVNVVGSLISQISDCGVYLNCGREVGVAATKSYTSQCIVLLLIGVWFAQYRGTNYKLRTQLINGLQSISFDVTETLKLENKCKEIAQKILLQNNCFILGSNYAEPIGVEAALKLKEIGYINAQGYPSGALKHGPFALLEDGTPIFFIILDNENSSKTHIAASATKTRGSYNIVITNQEIDNNYQHYDDILVIPNNYVSSILSIIPFQFIAYYLGVLKKTNPDKPRHLAKTVTVA